MNRAHLSKPGVSRFSEDIDLDFIRGASLDDNVSRIKDDMSGIKGFDVGGPMVRHRTLRPEWKMFIDTLALKVDREVGGDLGGEVRPPTDFAELPAVGPLTYIGEGRVWLVQGTLFWPLFGLEFPKYNIEDYAGYILYVLTHNPDAYVPEIIGIGILATFAIYFKLYRYERLRAFVADGRLINEAREKIIATG